jgi:hypothetical protein
VPMPCIEVCFRTDRVSETDRKADVIDLEDRSVNIPSPAAEQVQNGTWSKQNIGHKKAAAEKP